MAGALLIASSDTWRVEVRRELARRMRLWQKLLEAGGPKRVRTELIANLGIQRGRQGIYRAAEITRRLSRTEAGLAVAFRSYGDTYEDDLSESGMKYRYPKTDRKGTDDAEIIAAKEAAELGLPLFVVHQATPHSSHRDVRLATIRSWSDSRGFFIVDFIDSAYASQDRSRPEGIDVVPDSDLRRELRSATDAMLHFDTRCLVCGCRIPELLEAVPLRSMVSNGTEDSGARLLFCSLHAVAFRLGLFAIRPDDLTVAARDGGPTVDELGIRHRQRLDQAPLDREALRRHWLTWSDELDDSRSLR